MSDNRRRFLKHAAIFAVTGLCVPKLSWGEWLAQNFSASTLDEALIRLYADQEIVETDQIELKLPKIAENGAVVPITVTTDLTQVDSIAILVEKNPVPLAAMFRLSPQVAPVVSARLKMAETCAVIAIVKTGDSLYSARQTVKVTIGGCGG